MPAADSNCTAASSCAAFVIVSDPTPTESVDHSVAAGAESNVQAAEPFVPTGMAAVAPEARSRPGSATKMHVLSMGDDKHTLAELDSPRKPAWAGRKQVTRPA